MSINFNLWFIRDGMIKSSERREYQEDIDWVFHQAGTALTPNRSSSSRGSGATKPVSRHRPAQSPCR